MNGTVIGLVVLGAFVFLLLIRVLYLQERVEQVEDAVLDCVNEEQLKDMLNNV